MDMDKLYDFYGSTYYGEGPFFDMVETRWNDYIEKNKPMKYILEYSDKRLEKFIGNIQNYFIQFIAAIFDFCTDDETTSVISAGKFYDFMQFEWYEPWIGDCKEIENPVITVFDFAIRQHVVDNLKECGFLDSEMDLDDEFYIVAELNRNTNTISFRYYIVEYNEEEDD